MWEFVVGCGSPKVMMDVLVCFGCRRVLIFPKGNNVENLSMYLDVADSGNLPYGWSRYAHFSLAIVNQIHQKFTTRKGIAFSWINVVMQVPRGWSSHLHRRSSNVKAQHQPRLATKILSRTFRLLFYNFFGHYCCLKPEPSISFIPWHELDCGLMLPKTPWPCYFSACS
jgi:NADH:ubiquinone oxidoreductase subunit